MRGGFIIQYVMTTFDWSHGDAQATYPVQRPLQDLRALHRLRKQNLLIHLVDGLYCHELCLCAYSRTGLKTGNSGFHFETAMLMTTLPPPYARSQLTRDAWRVHVPPGSLDYIM